MNNNPYDNNPYNRNQNGNMNGNPYGNRPPRPQNMNPGGYNPNGAPRPPYPQGAPTQARTSDDGTTKTIIIVVGVIIAVAIIALVSIFAIKHINENRQNETPGYTEVNININVSAYEDKFKSIENDYLDDNGNIPDSKIGEIVQKEYDYLYEYNQTNNVFTDVQMSDDKSYVYCTLPDGYTYYHNPRSGSYYEDENGNRTNVKPEESTPGSSGEDSTANYKDAAVELIYNFPKYGFEMNDTSVSIEMIDLDGDNVPEILYCDHFGSHGIPEIAKAFKLKGNSYEEINFNPNDATADDIGNSYLPIIPKRDSSDNICFHSELSTESELNEYDEAPSGGAFWYYYKLGVSEFELSGNTLTSTCLKDFSEYRNVIDSDEHSDEERNDAWKNYKSAVGDYHSEYKTDDSYKYTCAWRIRTGFINTDTMSESEQLDQYHEVMTKDAAEYIVEQYENNNHEFDFSDKFSSNY